jgi:hypothetical protein
MKKYFSNSKYKRIASLALAVVMLGSLLPLTVSGGGVY